MQLRLVAGVIAAATFAITFVLYPYASEIGQRLTFQQLLTAPAKGPVAATTQTPNCSAAFGKVLAALAAKPCE